MKNIVPRWQNGAWIFSPEQAAEFNAQSTASAVVTAQTALNAETAATLPAAVDQPKNKTPLTIAALLSLLFFL